MLFVPKGGNKITTKFIFDKKHFSITSQSNYNQRNMSSTAISFEQQDRPYIAYPRLKIFSFEMQDIETLRDNLSRHIHQQETRISIIQS